VGIDTAWSFMYRSKDGAEVQPTGYKSLGLEFDKDAELDDQNYKLKDGCMSETGELAVPRSYDQVYV
jgi:hypothetical protein